MENDLQLTGSRRAMFNQRTACLVRARNWRMIRSLTLCLMGLHLSFASLAGAQEPTSGQNTQSPTEVPIPAKTGAAPVPDQYNDLLELLDSADKKAAIPATTGQRAVVRPEDIGLDDAQVNSNSANPLEAVRQSMLIASEYLRQGAIGADTQQLQRDIVQRLDDLIGDADSRQGAEQGSSAGQGQAQQDNQQEREGADETPDNQPADTANSSERSSEDGANSAPHPAGEPSQSGEETGREVDGVGAGNSAASQADADSSANGMGGGQIGSRPAKTDDADGVAVKSGDIRALQQSVWGQLPERVRRQMQSRMTERFLPAYRKQIEAYFQALLDR